MKGDIKHTVACLQCVFFRLEVGVDTLWHSVLNDPAVWFWWVGIGVLLVIELMAGTFYLLMLALGFLAAGLARLSGASDGAQGMTAAVVALIAILTLRFIKRRYHRSQPLDVDEREVQRDPAANLDIGAAIYVAHWEGRRARVSYRGAEWDATLSDEIVLAAVVPGAAPFVAAATDADTVLPMTPSEANALPAAGERIGGLSTEPAPGSTSPDFPAPGWYRIDRIDGIRLILAV